DALEKGALIGEVITNVITPQVMQNPEMVNQWVRPFVDPRAMSYIEKYVAIHGLTPQTPTINRTDMLLTPTGPRANEVNPDAPEGYGISQAGERIQNLVNGRRKQSTLHTYFQDAKYRHLTDMGHKNVVIPYWNNS